MPEKIVIYAPNRWTNVHLLRTALKERGRETLLVRRANEDVSSHLSRVNWGARHPSGAALNADIPGNKHRELTILRNYNVVTPLFVVERPAVIGLEVGQWLPRTLQHRAAVDLLSMTSEQMPIRPFYVQRLETLYEFRIHCFRPDPNESRYVSIRAGLKVKARADAHPWIRTLATGWNTEYGTPCQDLLKRYRAVRIAAKNAVAALGLDFGAVDVAITPSGGVVVFEVNSAPGLANKVTAAAYARHIDARMP